jgi:phosphoribosylformylglycinamidine cyclo-ligase
MYLDDPSTERALDVLMANGFSHNGDGYFANYINTPAGNLAFATDGIGVKHLLAEYTDEIYNTIGIDCIAMVVNDLLCVGAIPYCVSDYLALKNQNPVLVEKIMSGLAAGAKEAHVDIVGGETAIIPQLGMEFDLSATAMGLYEDGNNLYYASSLRHGTNLVPGDLLIALTSSGIHCNGFSFLYQKYGDFNFNGIHNNPMWESLKEPTKIYVDAIMSLWRHSIFPGGIYHISGGGLLNLKRTPRSDLVFSINRFPPSLLFDTIKQDIGADLFTMCKTFNMGIGMIISVRYNQALTAMSLMLEAGFDSMVIGQIEERSSGTNTCPGVVIETKTEISF